MIKSLSSQDLAQVQTARVTNRSSVTQCGWRALRLLSGVPEEKASPGGGLSWYWKLKGCGRFQKLSVKVHEQIHTVGSHCLSWMGSRPELTVTGGSMLASLTFWLCVSHCLQPPPPHQLPDRDTVQTTLGRCENALKVWEGI